MKKLLLSAIAMMLMMTSFAQEKKMFTPEDASYNNREVYAKAKSFKWLGSSDKFVFNEDNEIRFRSPGEKSSHTLLTLDMINSIAKGNGVGEFKRMPNITWTTENGGYFFRMGEDGNITLNTLNIKDKSIKNVNSYPANAENMTLDAKTMRIAYTIGNDLYIANGGKQIRITENPEHVIAGQSVHRNEFAIDGGIFWSPDGSKLAYYLMDESMVTDYPLVDITTRIATEKPIKYPMAGMTSHIVKLHVYDIAEGTDVVMQTGEPEEHYLTSITWNNDNKNIYIGILNRGQDTLNFNEYNALNGEFKQTIFTDIDEQYVEPQGPAHFLPGSTTEFVWLAQRDGYYHLWLHNTKTLNARQIEKGDYVVTSFDGFDGKGNAYYTSTEVSPLQRHFYKVSIKNGKKVKITKKHGTHSVLPSKSGRYFIDNYTSIDVPRAAEIVDANGRFIDYLYQAENPIKDYNIGVTEIDSIEAEDGQMLYTRIIKPYNFDENKKYPVIVYVYGGPHAQLITDTWLAGAGIYLNYLAQEGFIVFTVDNRGSADRGEAFEQIIHRQCGQMEMHDQMTGIEYLKTKPYVDADRIGSDGWSYGGFMSTSLKINYPETFKVSVAGGPVINWKYYEIMYGERYMDTPQENPEGYELTALDNKTDKLEGKLLIIHCSTDPTVVWQHSLSFLENAIHNQKQMDYFVYPGHDHNVYGMDRAHLITKITEY
ncbi:MAG: DPP IV N-terminal domain-containing protein, partial [Bacteroidales bacterium]|nr:DPP IV N-terminal domain-containing protein [Bacteroidales bacterium]